MVGLLHEAHDAGYAKGYHDGQVDSCDQRAMDRAQADSWSDAYAERKVREIIEANKTLTNAFANDASSAAELPCGEG